MRLSPKSILGTTLLCLPSLVNSKAILGVDLGSLYMKVALVQRNSPLEIVTNLHSKRKTEQMVLFDQGSRFYGADASSLLARKPHLTPAAMSVMLGRDHEHPTVQVLAERHYPITPAFNETRSGVCLTVNGQDFTPEELVAMVLSHAKDITAAYGAGSEVRDCVLTVPSFYTQHERRALLDAAALADLNVLALINENTAAALHFGIDRIDETPQHFVFYNMGASALQVSVVRYYSYQHKDSKYAKAKTVGAFEVIGSAWDSTLGGLAFDNRLVDYMADEFNEMWNAKRNDGETKDVRINARAMTKLRLQANKVKHVLSANSDIPVYLDALHDDTSYQTHISRAKFEEICHDLLLRSTTPITNALAAANKTLDDIDGVEMIGGGMRVPKVQDEIRTALGGKLDLGMHINSDESMALGAAFHGANVSTAFRVRHVGMTDINPFPISIDLSDLPADESKGWFGKKDKKEGDEEEEEEWSKHATVFKKHSKIGIKKTIAFTHDSDVRCSIDYEESDFLPKGTGSEIEHYDIGGIAEFAKEMADKGLAKPKVSLQFELSTSGITQLVKAEAAVEEIITVTEEVEYEEEVEEEESDAAAAEGEEKAEEEEKKEEGEAKEGEEEEKKEGEEEEKKEGEEEKKEEEKPKKKKVKKTKTVEKEKKKVHKKILTVKTYHVGRVKPYSAVTMEESKAKLAELARKDRERIMLEEARNKVESYIYQIKNKLIDDEENVGKVTTEEQRSALSTMAEEAEDWMYDDGYNAGLATMEDKYVELSTPAEKVWFRVTELTARPEAIKSLEKKMKKIEDLMAKWETTMDWIPAEDREGVLTKLEGVKATLAEKVKAQEETDPSEDPVLLSAEIPKLLDEVKTLVTKLSKTPKPKPVVKEEKNDTKAEEDAKEGEEKADDTAATEEEKKEGGDDESSKEEEAGEGDDEL